MHDERRTKPGDGPVTGPGDRRRGAGPRAAAAAESAAYLAGAVAAHRIQFLATELAVANTLLDAAAVSQNLAYRARRVALAEQARDEVARHLAGDLPADPPAAGRERAALVAALAALQARLAGAGVRSA